jgi:hypothetical protein
MKTKDNKPVSIQVPKELARQAEGLFAWVTDKQGNLIEKVALKGGQAQLKTESRVFHGQAKVYIAPDFPEAQGKRKVNGRLLEKAGAYQPAVKLREGYILDLNRIPDLERFRFRLCNITGTVTKTFILDGISKVLPVCNVRVHICEVDPVYFILPHIPDLEIIDIRDRLIDIIVHEKFPIPIPDPWPDPPIPDPIGPIIRFARPMEAKFLKKEQAEMQALSLPILEDEVISGLSSRSLDMVRQTLQKNYLVLRPYLCLFPRRWPFLYRCDEIAVVTPDCNGRFEHLYFYLENGDKPDIYVWVEANIDGSWETVYKPPKACSTHWNYTCGSDIDIRISDARVKPCECSPIPGQAVWMKRVNDGVSIRNIRQNSSGSAHIANAIGLTQYSSGDYVSPFGSSFPFVVQFGSGFPGGGATHYRWSYRQVKDAHLNNVVDALKPLTSSISKWYTYERINSDGDTVFYTGSFLLGPFPSPTGPLYKIPHTEASVDVPAEPTAEWNQDTYSIGVNSANLNDGLYEFVFELLDNNGNVVPLDKDVFLVDKKDGEVSNPPDAPTITAFARPENYLLLNGSNKAIGFKFLMRLDNNACFADIRNALVDGAETQTLCGFGQYLNKATSQVTLRFLAGHPHNFAHYGFSVVKGNGNPAGPTNTSGYVTQAHDGYSVANDDFSKNVPVADMLGICDKAAFAENLYIWATHTNGSWRLNGFDASDTAAFAIEPKLPTVEP